MGMPRRSWTPLQHHDCASSLHVGDANFRIPSSRSGDCPSAPRGALSKDRSYERAVGFASRPVDFAPTDEHFWSETMTASCGRTRTGSGGGASIAQEWKLRSWRGTRKAVAAVASP